MTIIDYVRYGNVFEYQSGVLTLKTNEKFVCIMEPNETKIKVIGLSFFGADPRLELKFNEDVSYTGNLLRTDRQTAHNRSSGEKSKVKIGETESIIDIGKNLYEFQTIGSDHKWNMGDHHTNGWILNPHTTYGFILHNGYPMNMKCSLSILWNECC